MNLKIAVPALLGAIIILLIISRMRDTPETARAARTEIRGGKSAIIVNASIVKAEILENNIVATGSLLANEEVEIRSEVSGKITKIYFREGGNVKKGDLLVKINDSDLQA